MSHFLLVYTFWCRVDFGGSISGTTSRALPPAREWRWGVAAELGFAYSPVNFLFLLVGLAIIVSSERLVECVDVSSDPLFLLVCSWLSGKACACGLEEVPGSALWAISFVAAAWTWGPAA